MNDRLKIWARILGILALCIFVSFAVLTFWPETWSFIISTWAFVIVLGLPGILTFFSWRNFRNTLRCYRHGTAYQGKCTGKRFRARESFYVVEWENEYGLQEEEFTAGIRMFSVPPFRVTVYELDEHRCLGKLAVIETGILAVLFLLIQIGAAIPIILIICDLAGTS